MEESELAISVARAGEELQIRQATVEAAAKGGAALHETVETKVAAAARVKTVSVRLAGEIDVAEAGLVMVTTAAVAPQEPTWAAHARARVVAP